MFLMDCVETRDLDSIKKILAANNKALKNFDRQLPGNHAFI